MKLRCRVLDEKIIIATAIENKDATLKTKLESGKTLPNNQNYFLTGPFPGSNNTSEEASFVNSNDETRMMSDSPRGSISSDSGALPHQRPFTDSSGGGGGMAENNDGLAGGEELDPDSSEEQTGQSAAEYLIATVACLSVLGNF